MFWHSLYLSVLLRCSGSHVVDFLHGCWSLSFGPYLLKGLDSSAQHVRHGKVSITERPALSKAHPEF